MNQADRHRRAGLASSPGLFFALVFLLTLPFWVLGAAFDLQLMPGLPLSSLMVVTPMLAAVLVRWSGVGYRGALGLLARAADVRRSRAPAAVAMLILVNPLIYAASYLAQTMLGVDLPAPDIRFGQTVALFAVFFAAATVEELGWSGHALDALRQRRSAVQAALILGVVWAVWHFVPLVQVGRSIEWIAWWTVGTVAARVLMVWFYERTGHSVFLMSVYHAISNTCWQLYPVQGTFYDPRINAAMSVLLVLIIVRPWKRAGTA